MRKLLPLSSRGLPLFTAASSRRIEATAQAVLPAHALMERAGLAVARLALALQPGRGTIWIACGPGNNGGDGLVAARLLHAIGQRVQLSLIDADKKPPADAAAALQAAQQAGVAIALGPDAPADTVLAIDALLGLGLSRAPGPAMAEAIGRLNALSAPVLAVDLPSGLLADSGALAGTEAVLACHTLSLLSLKPGLFTGQGRAHSGEIWFDDLGIAPREPANPADQRLLGPDCLASLGRPGHASHKGSQGDVLVIGGAPGMRGAALLAARAALAAGAGRVYACPLGMQGDELDAGRPELMRWREASLDQAATWAGKTIVAGCGGGSAIRASLLLALRQAERLVLDADALNAIAADELLRRLLSARQQPSLLTPHPLEAARLLKLTTAAVQADRLGAAQALAEALACTVILKGSGSVIAAPGRLPCINSSGNAALATAGTGDVLAGWLGGLWAQRPDIDPHALACAGAFWHGTAAETQQAGPLRAADLVERMHALHRIHN